MTPVVTRTLQISELEKAARAHDRIDFLQLLAQTDYICGSGEYEFLASSPPSSSSTHRLGVLPVYSMV